MGAGASSKRNEEKMSGAEKEKYLELIRDNEKKNEKMEKILHKILTELMETKTSVDNSLEITQSTEVKYGMQVSEEFEQLRSLLDHLQSVFQNSTTSVTSLKVKMQQKLNSIEQERDELKKKVAEMQQELNTTVEKHTVHEKTLTEKIVHIEKAEKVNTGDFKKQIDSLQKELNEEKRKNAEEVATLTTKLDVTIKHMKKENEKLLSLKDREIAKVTDEKNSVQKQLSDQIEELKKKFQKISEDLQKTKIDSNTVEQSLKSKLEQHVIQIQDLNREKDKLQIQIVELQKQHKQDYDKIIDDRDKMKMNYIDMVKNLEMKVVSLEVNNQTLTKSSKEKVKDLTAERDKYKEELEKKSKEHSDYKIETNEVIHYLKTEITQLKEQVANLIKENDLLKEKLKTQEEEMKKMRLKISSFIQEIDQFTLSHSLFRLTTNDLNMKLKLVDFEFVLEKFMEFSETGGALSFCSFMKLMLKLDFMEGVNVTEIMKLLEKGDTKNVGFIEIISAYKDLNILHVAFSKIGDGGYLSRLQLKKTFEESGLLLYKPEYLKSFNAIVMIVDKSGDEHISHEEFMGLGLTLIVFKLMFVKYDKNANGELSLDEVRSMLNEYQCESDLLTKIKVNFDVFSTERDVVKFEGFIGLILDNIKRSF